MSNSILSPARPLLPTTIEAGKFAVTVVVVGPPLELNVPFIAVTVGDGVICTYEITGLDNENVALVYVPAATLLKASGDRRPRRRAKSTVVGVVKTCAEVLLLPFKVIELMVTSKPTTEASGASSPVTNTFAGCDDKEALDPALQPTPSIESEIKSVIPKSLFMANSIRRFVVKSLV